MDSRIKTGKDLKCDYTGNEVEAVIKIYGKDDQETGWMCQEVLQQACNLLSSADKKKEPVMRRLPKPVPHRPIDPVPMDNKPAMVYSEPQPHVQAVTKGVAAPTIKRAGMNPKVPAGSVKQFEAAVKDLKENPPRSRDSDPEGVVPESAIRELIKGFLPYFGPNPNQMFTPLRKAFNMEVGRFKMLIEGMK